MLTHSRLITLGGLENEDAFKSMLASAVFGASLPLAVPLRPSTGRWPPPWGGGVLLEEMKRFRRKNQRCDEDA